MIKSNDVIISVLESLKGSSMPFEEQIIVLRGVIKLITSNLEETIALYGSIGGTRSAGPSI